MSAFKVAGRGWVSKFQYRGKELWTPGGPWATKSEAQQAERRYRDRLESSRTEETCATSRTAGSRSGRGQRHDPPPLRGGCAAVRREFGHYPLGDVDASPPEPGL